MDIIDLAKYKTKKDYNNEHFLLITEIITDFCKSNNIILNFNQTETLIFNLYTTYPYNNANNLTNILFNKTKIKYIILHTKIPNKELIISINNVKYIYIYLLLLPNKNIYNLFNIKQLQLPIVIQFLLEINKLCSVSNILSNTTIDDSIIVDFKKQYKYYKKTITIFNNLKCKIIELLYNYLLNENIILLDYYAIQLLKQIKIDKFYNTIHLLYENDNIFISLKNILKDILLKLNIKGDIIIKNDNNLYIINDFRLKKTTIYLNMYNSNYKNNNKLILINCYNLLTYNIIPIINNIPHPIIILKFLIINTIYIILFSKNKNMLYQNINLIYDILNTDFIFNEKYKFIGIFKNEELDLDLHHVYRPAQYLLQHNELRKI